MKRLDAALVELGLAPSRTKAQRLIEAGDVEVLINGEWKLVTQSSYSVKGEVRVKPGSRELKYVSRGGLKLESALQTLKLDVTGWRCLDVGTSTGGFADCLIKHGAAHVTGFDVGHGQLSPKLQTDKKLKHYEGVHIKDLPDHRALGAERRELNLVTVDVSFISLSHVLPVLGKILEPGTKLLALVKPQFEVGPQNLDKNGIVRDSALYGDVKSQVLRDLIKCGFSFQEYFACGVKGQDGNQEFFVFATRA